MNAEKLGSRCKYWKQALNTEAVKQLQHIKVLLYAYPYLNRIPDQSLLISGQGDSVNTKTEVMRNGTLNKTDATYIMVYLSPDKKITLKTNFIRSDKLNMYWFDPRTGFSEVIAKHIKNTGTYTPRSPDAKDWVLVIDNCDKKYHLPLKKLIDKTCVL